MGRGTSKAGGGSGSIKKFADKASGTHEYSGSGADVKAFFDKNSNYNELINSMSSDDIDAFRAWTNGYFMDGSQYNGFDNLMKHEKDMVRAYDKYLDQATLKEGVEVARLSDAQLVLGAGNSTPSLKALQAMQGKVIKCQANLSTGAAAEGLTIGSHSKKVEYHISIPKGTKGAGMWIGDKRINGWGTKQREFMMNRDVFYKVGKTSYDKKRGIYVVELAFDCRDKHDYGSK